MRSTPPKVRRSSRSAPAALASGCLQLLLVALLLSACASAPTKPAPTGKPGSSKDNPIRVERMTEEVDRVNAEKCPGGGRWQMTGQVSDVTGELGCSLDKISVSCTTSPEPSVFWFLHCM